MSLMSFNEHSIQTQADHHWDEGRRIDMDAFDQLPRQVRDWINENDSFYPIEDVLYEHLNDHRGDYELTLVWLIEAEEFGRSLQTSH